MSGIRSVLIVDDSSDDADIAGHVVAHSTKKPDGVQLSVDLLEDSDSVQSHIESYGIPSIFVLDGQFPQALQGVDLAERLVSYGRPLVLRTGGIPQHEAVRLHELWTRGQVTGVFSKDDLHPLDHLPALLYDADHRAHHMAREAISASTQTFFKSLGLM